MTQHEPIGKLGAVALFAALAHLIAAGAYALLANDPVVPWPALVPAAGYAGAFVVVVKKWPRWCAAGLFTIALLITIVEAGFFLLMIWVSAGLGRVT